MLFLGRFTRKWRAKWPHIRRNLHHVPNHVIHDFKINLNVSFESSRTVSVPNGFSPSLIFFLLNGHEHRAVGSYHILEKKAGSVKVNTCTLRSNISGLKFGDSRPVKSQTFALRLTVFSAIARPYDAVQKSQALRVQFLLDVNFHFS